MSKKMGRPPGGPRKVQAFVFLPPEQHAWFMAIPPQERTAWLVAKIEQPSIDAAALDAALAQKLWPPQHSNDRITAWNEAIQMARSIVKELAQKEQTHGPRNT